jgi:DNA repair protein SbcD/Mre11
MRLVHISDIHLGYRQYQRMTPGGINQREADVAQAFRRAIDATIALAPDVVLFAGDIFHNVRPSNPAIVHAFQQFARLRAELPQAAVVMIAGNHDTPRAAETGCILRLFIPLGVRVVDSTSERISFPEHDLSIMAVPDAAAATHPVLTPDSSARYNILLLHSWISEMVPGDAAISERPVVSIPRGELHAELWSYVALGHYHVHRKVDQNAYYSGSLDYTSTNTWSELVEERAGGIRGKGFIEYDLDTQIHKFHSVSLARGVVDLQPISARGLTGVEVDARIRESVDRVKGGIDDKIVRQRIREIPRHIVRDLDHHALREFRKRALHFQLDTSPPEVIRSQSQAGAPGRRPTLAEIVRDKLHGRVLESDIDRSSLVDLGLQYLAEAEAVTVAAVATEVEGGDG